ncbi:MAG: PulJ/GspJ family protein [Gemmatimonadaceae bacterium]
MRERRGVSLVELIVALSILAGSLLAMSGLFVVVSQRGNVSDADLRRVTVMERTIGMLQTVPFASLEGKAGEDSSRTASGWVKRTITVNADPGGDPKRRQIIVKIEAHLPMKSQAARFLVDTFYRTTPSCALLNTGVNPC